MCSSLLGMRQRPLAPTCNVCLIRDDLTTIWCEVTSSICTRSLTEEYVNLTFVSNNTSTQGLSSQTSSSADSKSAQQRERSDSFQRDEVKEFLLCLRPIRDGEVKVGKKFRFVPSTKPINLKQEVEIEMASTVMISSGGGNTPCLEHDIPVESSKNHPMKKRSLPITSLSGFVSNGPKEEPQQKKIHTTAFWGNSQMDTEKSVAESLMLMSSHHSN